MGELSRLFAPERVAVVGASDEAGTVGHAVTSNLLASFEGEVLAVNPNQESVLGLTCHDSVTGVDGIDAAVVAVPAGIAVGVVREAAEAGVENVVVITAGFSEAGSEGSTREGELIRIAEEHDLNLVGPNSLGIMNTGVGLNATFGPRSPDPGSISFMSQSGAFITAVLDWAEDRNVGFKDVVSLGNKTVPPHPPGCRHHRRRPVGYPDDGAGSLRRLLSRPDGRLPPIPGHPREGRVPRGAGVARPLGHPDDRRPGRERHAVGPDPAPGVRRPDAEPAGGERGHRAHPRLVTAPRVTAVPPRSFHHYSRSN